MAGRKVNEMTPAMFRALVILWANGVVYAGRNTLRGGDFRVAYNALRALEKNGYVKIQDIPGGGYRAVAA